MYDQGDNFYSHYCKRVGSFAYIATCRKRIAGAANACPTDCAEAIKKHGCPAAAMVAEEAAAFRPIYYLDRDDAGPGVMSRAELGREPRDDATIAAHHALLERVKLKPRSRELPPPPVSTAKKRVVKAGNNNPVISPAPAAPAKKPPGAFGLDIGAMINAELAK